MKYQCTVCNQIINTNESCPICGSDGSKIIELPEIESTTFRCLSCGRVFENKDICPYCGGEELYDLTHDEMFNRNDKKKEEVKEEETPDLFSSMLNEDKPFEDKIVDLNKVEVKEEQVEAPVEEEDTSSLINDDLFNNSDVILHEEKEEIKDDLFKNSEPEDFKNELFDESLFEETKEETPVFEEEPVKEESFANEEIKEEVAVQPELKEEKHVEVCEGDCDCEENEEEHECCCNHEEHSEETHDCCCHHEEENHEEEGHCCHHEGGMCLKEQRNLLRKEILYSLLVRNKDYISLSNENMKEEDRILFEELLKEIEVMEENEAYSLEELFEAKVETEREIFKKRPSPLEGYLLFKDEEILKKIKKGE